MQKIKLLEIVKIKNTDADLGLNNTIGVVVGEAYQKNKQWDYLVLSLKDKMCYSFLKKEISTIGQTMQIKELNNIKDLKETTPDRNGYFIKNYEKILDYKDLVI